LADWQRISEGNVKIEELTVDEIIVPEDRMRNLNNEKVQEIAASMAKVGQICPILVRRTGGEDGLDPVLVAGAHRLRAAQFLNWIDINAITVKCKDVEARLVEIAENLHRADLTVTERSEHIAEWIRLTEEKAAESKPNASQVETHKKGQQPGGVNAAARELGITKSEAHRAVEIASISSAAKEALRSAKLDDNQSVALKIASHPDDDQVKAVVEIVAERAAKHDLASPALLPAGEMARPLRNLVNIAAGQLVRWIKITTPILQEAESIDLPMGFGRD
jgi:ParB family chromosome partitioning protein